MENLNFEHAFEALKMGFDVKLPEWAGFWRWSDNSIKMHGKDGIVRDIRETADVGYTLRNLLRKDWIIIPKGEEPKNLDIQTFTFGEAIRNLKAGKKVSRKGWNGKGMFLFLLPSGKIPVTAIYDPTLKKVAEEMGTDHFDALPSIRMKTADNKILTGWLASQTDMFAEDWCLVE